MSTTTKERLALALEEAGAPKKMVENARAGRFDTYESQSATPLRDLVDIAAWTGLTDIADRAMRGEWDGTAEEALAWERRRAERAALEWRHVGEHSHGVLRSTHDGEVAPEDEKTEEAARG